MKFKNFLSKISLFAVLLFAFFTVGCEKNEVVEEITNTQEQIQDVDVSEFYPSVNDAFFNSEIEGKIILPENIELSDKVKTILLERLEESKDYIRIMGNIQYDEEAIKNIELYGESKEEAQNFFKEINFPLDKLEQGSNNRSSYSWSYNFTSVPHYYQFNSSENPTGKYWCGHANLKCVADKHGQYKTLSQIHNAFMNNSTNYSNNTICPPLYCSAMTDLLWCANNQNNQSWNYDLENSSTEETNSQSNFYQRLRDGVDYNKPVISANTHHYGAVGHFYTVKGYLTVYNPNGSINYNKSYVFLRDVALPNPTNDYYDRYVKVSDYYNSRIGNSILFVRPN